MSMQDVIRDAKSWRSMTLRPQGQSDKSSSINIAGWSIAAIHGLWDT